MSEFGLLLRAYRRRAEAPAARRISHPMIVGMSQNELARRAGVNAAYVNRLESGKQAASPSRDVVEMLAAALELGGPERDRLLVSAGHWPWALDDAGLDAVLGVGRALADRTPRFARRRQAS